MQKMWKSCLVLLSVCIMVSGCDLQESQKDDRLTSETKTGEKKAGTPAAVVNKIKPETPEKALEYIMKSLHTPYQNGEYFFKIFGSGKAEHVVTPGKKGKHHVTFLEAVADTAANNCKTPISYKYENYQGTDENIIIDGELVLFERTVKGKSATGDCCTEKTATNCPDMIGLRKSEAIGGKNVLTISGDFDAKLEFVRGTNDLTDISTTNYDNHFFVNGGSSYGHLKIVLHYAGKQLEMYTEKDAADSQKSTLFKKMLKVAK